MCLLRCAVRRRLPHPAVHHPAAFLGRVAQDGYATEEMTAATEANQAERQSVILISNPAA